MATDRKKGPHRKNNMTLKTKKTDNEIWNIRFVFIVGNKNERHKPAEISYNPKKTIKSKL